MVWLLPAAKPEAMTTLPVPSTSLVKVELASPTTTTLPTASLLATDTLGLALRADKEPVLEPEEKTKEASPA